MSPFLGKDHEPDERPSTAELVGALIFAIVIAFCWWIFSIITAPIGGNP